MLIDYFLYFNEKELLELRINLLKDHVDKFVICESSKTFSGIPREFQVKKLIKELGLPEEKIQVIELVIPEDRDLIVEDHDALSMFPEDRGDIVSIRAMARDRLTRNGLMTIIDQFSDDDWFIVSDCDEIINPEHIGFALHMANTCQNTFIKLPLINLYGEADLRPYFKDGSPFTWRTAMTICRRTMFYLTTPQNIRCDWMLPFNWANPTVNGVIFENFGWHFSWMGGSERVAIKSQSYAHAPNKSHIEQRNKGFKFVEGESLTWENNSVLLKFPHNELPQEIFRLPRVLNFLLPNYSKKQVKKLSIPSRKF